MGRKLGLVVLAVFVLLGCDNAISDKLLDELTLRYASQVDTAKKYLALEQAHELGPLEDKTDPVWKDAQLHTNLEKVAAVFPDAAPLSVKVVGLRRGFFNGKSGEFTMTTVTLEYEFPKKWVAGTVMLLEKDKVETIGGISAYALPDLLENLNKFRLSGKPMTSYVMLALTCIVPVFVLYVLVLCAKTPIPKRKWLWVLFVLLGFVTFQLNWTDGSLRVVPLSFQLFAAGVSSPGPYSPTILSLSIPLGAIVFLLRRKKLTASEPL